MIEIYSRKLETEIVDENMIIKAIETVLVVAKCIQNEPLVVGKHRNTT